ncbi:ferrous iron transport protein A [Marispirochaeta sp.]|uniref:FeoA family protein n=1 Tax=Marispirochaeta sp. TaxID=2038653 RepID=UPI0029C8F524|nr:ferrous iron transport protein A [Marispirochaeta sp.]
MRHSDGNTVAGLLSAADLRVGRSCRVISLGKGRSFRARMVSLGVRPGAVLTIVGGHGKGPRLLQVGPQRVMIGAEMVRHIFVTEEPNNE